MATEHEHEHRNRSILVHSYWHYAVLIGGIAGLVRPIISAIATFGVVPAVLETPGVLETLPEFGLWWIIHIMYSAVFGSGFGLMVYNRRLRPLSESVPTAAVLGLVYGVALWVGNVVIGWNYVLTKYVLSTVEPIDPLTAGPIIDHLLYGVVLGIIYAAAVPRLAPNYD
jgi:hypothetical protein